MEVYRLANIKSAKKRILVTETKDKAAAEAAYKDASSVIESACSKGVYHKNNAARKVSRLAKLVNGIA